MNRPDRGLGQPAATRSRGTPCCRRNFSSAPDSTRRGVNRNLEPIAQFEPATLTLAKVEVVAHPSVPGFHRELPCAPFPPYSLGPGGTGLPKFHPLGPVLTKKRLLSR